MDTNYKDEFCGLQVERIHEEFDIDNDFSKALGLENESFKFQNQLNFSDGDQKQLLKLYSLKIYEYIFDENNKSDIPGSKQLSANRTAIKPFNGPGKKGKFCKPIKSEIALDNPNHWQLKEL